MAYTSINKPIDYFESKTYTGTTADQDITGLSFQPDFAWFKVRSEVGSHRLQDSVRGTTKVLFSNGTDAEATDSNLITSFNSDGYTLKGAGSINENTRTYVSWNWLVSDTTTSNTDGSITSTVSANTTSGLSIVSYTGTGANATVGHGLGVTPKMVIAKGRSNIGTWSVYHEGIGNAANGVSLENSSGTRSEPAYWNSTAPTSSVFSVGTSADTNGSSRTYIAYCFAEKKGFSKFGSYIGNGSADGPFLYTGFKPAFIMVKRTDAINQWMLIDNKRTPSNTGTVPEVFADLSDAENVSTDGRFDYLSNGLKARGTNAVINASGGTYIYMAYAESPFTTSTGIPTTAR